MHWVLRFLAILVVLLLILKIYLKITTKWCMSQVCLVGKTVIVTGANTGIGYETALDLAKRGARVILACRNQDLGDKAAKKIINETGNTNVCCKILDLASFKSVREFAEDINKNEKSLDILVNNAGCGGLRERTRDGFGITMQVNYFGHFLLTNLLLDLLKKSAPSRIINLSSSVAKYTSLSTFAIKNLDAVHLPQSGLFARSKLCAILFTKELHEHLKGTGVTAYSVHPGIILTRMWRHLEKSQMSFVKKISVFGKDMVEGAQTTIYCAVEKDIEQFSGGHFDNCTPVKTYASAMEYDTAKELWEKSEQLVGLQGKSKTVDTKIRKE